MKLIKIKKKYITNIYINNSYKKICNFLNNKKYFLIFDYNIYILFFKFIKFNFKKYKFIILPYGENIKNINSLKIIWKYMIKNKINKNFITFIIGGGVIGDLVSYICSSYFRGINFVLLPTSLLSQIDSSIGGKNAINFFSKNTLGIINCPKFIFINYLIIFYMKKKEFKDGYSEIIKYSLLNNKKFFFYLFKKKNIKKIIIRSCYIKSKIIAQDYNEINFRSILNLGHTYAHCIENNKIKNFSHGESVSIGIIFVLFISSFYYFFCNITIKKILNLFLKFNFFIKNKIKFSKKMINKIILDKKFDNKINYIIIRKIGFCIKKNLKKKILIMFLKKFYEI
ncbi:3-dehydroquinate synthase family protein [Candidatus Carsonella ruddii]|uniref:3-dehydroquinate synthase n=1 Tax=Carsonella ruddii TaxID=114186 RepID=A0A1U9RRA7_CARRU|nr:3-dehydroquinate synthase family protein [Candidatus Carsonella ruddii]AQU89448.1 3-dehydroquinate synthase [Candidatus Carsonella ruddii]